jgi:uncharacterized membrane protein
MLDSNAKLVGVLSYVTILGWIIAIVLHSNNRSEFGAFHLRQSLGLFLTGLILGWIPVIGWLLWIVVIAFLIVGLVYALQEEMKVVPLVGEFYQTILSGIR